MTININIKKRPKTKKKSPYQTGRGKLGEGGYGCIVEPAIACPNYALSTTKKSISKIIHIRNQGEYNEELDIYNKLALVDPGQKFFVLIKAECLLDIDKAMSRKPKDFISTAFEDKKGKKYKILEPEYKYLEHDKDEVKYRYCKLDKTRHPRNIIMDYAGEDLSDVINSNYSQKYNLCQKYVVHIIRNMLLSVKKMHKVHIVHRDIKPENLMFIVIKKKDKKTGRLVDYPNVRFIDFGLSQNVDKLNQASLDDDSVSYRGTSGYIPLEIDLLQYMNFYSSHYDMDEPQFKYKTITATLDSYRESKLSTAYFITKTTDSHEIAETESKATKLKKLKKIYTDIDNLFNTFKAELETHTLPAKFFEYADGYIYKTDIFALGITIQKIAKRLNFINGKLLHLVKNMTAFDPNERYTIDQCLAHPLFNTLKKK